MTDEQIIKNLQAVLDTIHHPESGIFQELNLEQKRTLEQDLADKRNNANIRTTFLCAN